MRNKPNGKEKCGPWKESAQPVTVIGLRKCGVTDDIERGIQNKGEKIRDYLHRDSAINCLEKVVNNKKRK